MRAITKETVFQEFSKPSAQMCFKKYEGHRPYKNLNGAWFGTINLPFPLRGFPWSLSPNQRKGSEHGGTLHAGNETLKMGLPLYVVKYQDMCTQAQGNQLLLARGAKSLVRSRNANRANLNGLLHDVQASLLTLP